jgi:hypothetical protein
LSSRHSRPKKKRWPSPIAKPRRWPRIFNPLESKTIDDHQRTT